MESNTTLKTTVQPKSNIFEEISLLPGNLNRKATGFYVKIHSLNYVEF